MNQTSTVEPDFSEAPPRVSEWHRLWRVFFSRGTVAVGFSILLVVVLMAVFAPFLAPYDPYQVGVADALIQPDSRHWLGSDTLVVVCLQVICCKIEGKWQ